MRTQPLDFILSTLAITLLGGLSIALMAGLLAPLTIRVLGAYHVLIDGILLLLIYGLLSAFLVRVMLRLHPLRAGEYAMDSSHFTYWKFFTVIHEFGRGAMLPFTTVFAKPLVGKLFGARIGINVAMGGTLVDPPFISVGDYAILGLDSALVAHAITAGAIILKPVKVGHGATVGVHVVVMPGAEIGEGAVITAGSVVTMNTHIPPREMWGGVPARKIKDLQASDVRG